MSEWWAQVVATLVGVSLGIWISSRLIGRYGGKGRYLKMTCTRCGYVLEVHGDLFSPEDTARAFLDHDCPSRSDRA